MTKDLFCDRETPSSHRIIAENDLAYTRWDNIPAAKGHAQIVPKRHVVSVFDLTPEEVLAMYSLRAEVRAAVLEEFGDLYDGNNFTIGYNEGELAGRSIDHVHEHMIPRRKGDTSKVVGGVRRVIDGDKYAGPPSTKASK